MNSKRYGSRLGLNADKLEEDKGQHAAAWPDVLKIIHDCNIRNYSIFLRQRVDGGCVSNPGPREAGG